VLPRSHKAPEPGRRVNDTSICSRASPICAVQAPDDRFLLATRAAFSHNGSTRSTIGIGDFLYAKAHMDGDDRTSLDELKDLDMTWGRVRMLFR